ncbi:MAG: hypothetical protein WKG07_18305 [Hymenobacter sp.]
MDSALNNAFLAPYAGKVRVRVGGLLVRAGGILLAAHRGLLPGRRLASPPGARLGSERA